MSYPITKCLVVAAAKNKSCARETLRLRMEYNKAHGAFSTRGCRHDPPCEATQDEYLALVTALPETIILFDTKQPDP